jgi:hypothetical protein
MTDARHALTWIAQVRAACQHDEQGDKGGIKEISKHMRIAMMVTY